MVTYDEIKQKIIEALNLEDITADEIEDDAPLFNEGLGLDSVDAIELIIFLDNQYGIKIDNAGESREVFASIKTLTDFIIQKRLNLWAYREKRGRQNNTDENYVWSA
ncbi:MAG: phosphopantetheine-binding protein [Sulfurovaceae bacterium]